MSNFSDAKDRPDTDSPGAPLARLLEAMAEEWAKIADDLNQLGATVSSRATDCDGLANAVELQAFDTIQQRAQGQANFLSRLAHKIVDEQVFDRTHLNDLLEHIPFHAVRARLEATFDGRASTHSHHIAGDEIDWL